MLLPLLWAQPALGFALLWYVWLMPINVCPSIVPALREAATSKTKQPTLLQLATAIAQRHFNLAIEGYLSKQCTGNCFSSSFRCLCILHRMLWRPFPTSMNLLQRFSASASIFAWLLVARILLFNSKIYTSSSEAIR